MNKIARYNIDDLGCLQEDNQDGWICRYDDVKDYLLHEIDVLNEENAKLKAENEELKTEISIMSNYSDQYMPNEHLQEMYSELEKGQSSDEIY